ALPEGLAPTLFPRTTGCFSVQLREPAKFRIRNAEWGMCPAARRRRLDPRFRALQSALLSRKLKMVGGAGNAPVVTSDSCLRHRFYRPAAGTPPKIGSGGGSRAHRG